MDIEWARDLIICISGSVVTMVIIFIAVLAYSLYHRTRSILDSVDATATTIKELSSYVADEVVKPIIQVLSLVQGIRQGIDSITKYFKKEEGGGDG